MKKSVLAIAAAVCMTLSTSMFAAAGKYEVKAAESQVTWTGKKVVGGSHTGTLDIQSGYVTFNDKGPESGEFVIDMTTIKNTDITNATDNAKLVGHLNSADFFDTAVAKTAMFKIKAVKAMADGKFEATGDLTIKGKTNPATVHGSMAMAGEKLTADGQIKFDRTLYDVRYGSGKFFQNLGDKMISDDVEIAVKLVAYKASSKKS